MGDQKNEIKSNQSNGERTGHISLRDEGVVARIINGNARRTTSFIQAGLGAEAGDASETMMPGAGINAVPPSYKKEESGVVQLVLSFIMKAQRTAARSSGH